MCDRWERGAPRRDSADSGDSGDLSVYLISGIWYLVSPITDRWGEREKSSNARRARRPQDKNRKHSLLNAVDANARHLPEHTYPCVCVFTIQV